jgi:hypothetical protein
MVATIGLVAFSHHCAWATDVSPLSPPPPGVADSSGTADSGQAAGVFDSCHLGNVCGCDDCCGPCLCVRAGAVLLGRSSDPSRPLVRGPAPGIGNFAPTITVLDGSKFKDPMAAGPDIDLLYNCCDCCECCDCCNNRGFGLEARYFAVGQFAASVGPNPTGGTATLQYTNLPLVTANAVGASEYSQLASVEVNVRKDVVPCFLTLLAGYRHIELGEQIIGTTSFTGTNTSVFSTEAFNRLDGFQLGGEAVLWRPSCRFRVVGDAKVGLFGDATSNYGTTNIVGGAAGIATSTGTNTAFMSEWGITAVWQINCHFSARVGYEGLLVDGVALASQQIGTLNTTTGAATTVNTGTPIYQGLVFDFQYCW